MAELLLSETDLSMDASASDEIRLIRQVRSALLARPDLHLRPVIIDGLGSGHAAPAIHEETARRGTTIILIEQDAAKIAHLSARDECRTLLSDPRVTRCFGRDAYSQFATEFDRLPADRHPGLVASLTPLASRAKGILDERASAWYAKHESGDNLPFTHPARTARSSDAIEIRPAAGKPAPASKLGWPENTCLVNHRYGFIYCPIPKIASSSLKQWFMLTVGLTPESPAWTERAHVWVASRAIQFRSDFERGYFTFTFVRNPWSRLVSAYTQKFLHRAHHPDSPSRPVVESVCTVKSRPIDYDAAITFREFAEFIAAAPDAASLDYHWRPQHLYISNVNVDFVGKIENMQADFESICARLGVREQFLFSTLRQKYNEAAGEIVADRPAVELRAMSELPNYRSFYTPDLIELVGKAYAEDIRRFGYSFDQ